MAKTGSTLRFANYLGTSDRIFQSLKNTALGMRLSKELQKAASEMGHALRNSDFDALLAMEKLAVQRDFNSVMQKSST